MRFGDSELTRGLTILRRYVNAPRILKVFGGVAHLGERLICIQEVVGSSPISSTKISYLASCRPVEVMNQL